MGGFGSGRYPEQMVPRQDPLPAVTIKELQKHKVFTCGEVVPFANYTSANDFIRPDHILAGQAQRVENRVVFGFLVGTFKMLRAELKERSGNKAKPCQEAKPSQETKANFVQVSVTLSWSACNYGGERPWFLCPGRFEGPDEASEGLCGRRVSKLYLDGSWLICRHCLGVGYQSDHPWEGSRSLHRAQKIKQSLGGSRSLAEPFPVRPKHMHHCTYHMLKIRVHFLLRRFATGNSTGSSTEDRQEQAEPESEELEAEELEAEELEAEELGVGEEGELRGGKKPRPTQKSRPRLWERLDKLGEVLRSDADSEEEPPSSRVAPS